MKSGVSNLHKQEIFLHATSSGTVEFPSADTTTLAGHVTLNFTAIYTLRLNNLKQLILPCMFIFTVYTVCPTLSCVGKLEL